MDKLGLPVLFSDTQPAIDAVVNKKGRTKHYDLRIKYLALGWKTGLFDILKISTANNIADLIKFTKVYVGYVSKF